MRFRHSRMSMLVRELLRDEAISGKLIVAATILALLWANSPWAAQYVALWSIDFSIGVGDAVLSQDLRHWVNEGLMAVFFLVVGLEIKREFVRGELGKLRVAALPIAAAVGGMAVPALLYLALAGSDLEAARGWAIPMATDIAFAVGLLALAGSRVPSSLKLFLLTLAIVDDIGAIAVIALVYSSGIAPWALGLALVLSLAIALALKYAPRGRMTIFIIGGLVVWWLFVKSGVHATIAGVLLGLLVPFGRHADPRSFGERIERYAIPLSTLVIVPLFALANTGVMLSDITWTETGALVALGIVAGLVIGKAAGIVGATALLVRTNRHVRPPAGATWSQIAGVGWLGGIGFTVSIFVTELAFRDNPDVASLAKLAILVASVVSGLIGFLLVRRQSRRALVVAKQR